MEPWRCETVPVCAPGTGLSPGVAEVSSDFGADAKPLQSCPTPCKLMDCSFPGSSVHGILQATIPEWVAMPYSRGSALPRDRTCVSCVSCLGQAGSLPLGTPGKPVLDMDHFQSLYWLQHCFASAGSWKREESSRKTSISALLTMPKPLTVWITINCGKLWKRWEYQTTWPASWETCMQVRKQQLELDMEQQTGSK